MANKIWANHMSNKTPPRINQSLREAKEAILGNNGRRYRRWPAPTSSEVRSLRKSLNLSQSGFSQVFGVDITALRNWEQGKTQADQSASILLYLISEAPELIAKMVQKVEHRKIGSTLRRKGKNIERV